jgi:hypothetical protein
MNGIIIINETKAKVKIILRPTVSRPVRLGVRHPTGTRDQFFFLLEIFFSQLRAFYFVAPSLTRGLVCSLLLLLVVANAVALGSESHGTQDHILLSQLMRLPHPGGPGPRIYIPQAQGQYVCPKHLLTSILLHGVTFHPYVWIILIWSSRNKI